MEFMIAEILHNTTAVCSTFWTGVISSIITAVTAWYINRINNKNDLRKQLDSILKIAIEYPYLEDTSFTNTWEKKNLHDERYVRYDTYCIRVFNFCSRVCKFCGYNERRIKKFVNIKDWITVHKQRWDMPLPPLENKNGYSPKFKGLIDSYLRDEKFHTESNV